jgi:hypothetical protein
VSRNTLYLVIALLLAVIVAFGSYYFYEKSHSPALEVKVGNQSITVQ